jgi:hypothetical protein
MRRTWDTQVIIIFGISMRDIGIIVSVAILLLGI